MLVKTMQAVVDRVINLANIDGQEAGTDPRHAQAGLVLEINDSYRLMLEHYTSEGFREFITPTVSATGPSVPETGETYGVVDYPLNALSLQGFDVFYQGEWRELEEIDWEERRTVATQQQGSARPFYYSLRSFGSVSAATEAAGKIAFSPFVPSITYRLHVLQDWADITNVSHKLIFPNQAGHDLVVFDMVFKVAGLRDGDRAKRVELALRAIESAKERIGSFVPKVTQTGSKTIRRAANFRSGR